VIAFAATARRPPLQAAQLIDQSLDVQELRPAGVLLDRLTHHVYILEMNGDSYRLNQSKRRSRRNNPDTPKDDLTPT
jgi:IstB-like ATP binding protein